MAYFPSRLECFSKLGVDSKIIWEFNNKKIEDKYIHVETSNQVS